ERRRGLAGADLEWDLRGVLGGRVAELVAEILADHIGDPTDPERARIVRGPAHDRALDDRAEDRDEAQEQERREDQREREEPDDATGAATGPAPVPAVAVAVAVAAATAVAGFAALAVTRFPRFLDGFALDRVRLPRVARSRAGAAHGPGGRRRRLSSRPPMLVRRARPGG